MCFGGICCRFAYGLAGARVVSGFWLPASGFRLPEVSWQRLPSARWLGCLDFEKILGSSSGRCWRGDLVDSLWSSRRRRSGLVCPDCPDFWGGLVRLPRRGLEQEMAGPGQVGPLLPTLGLADRKGRHHVRRSPGRFAHGDTMLMRRSCFRIRSPGEMLMRWWRFRVWSVADGGRSRR